MSKSSDANQTPQAQARVQTVQSLLRQDVSLSAYEASHRPCPLSIQFVPSAFDLSKGDLEACLSLIEETSGHDYKASSVGWNPRKKREEMLDGDMMYILLRQSAADKAEQSVVQENQEMNDAFMDTKCAKAQVNAASKQPSKPSASNSGTANTVPSIPLNSILGFTSFMFTYDDPPHQDREVLYIYEIHLHERLRGQGLGSQLITFIEDAARACRVNKTMLTVFTANTRAKGMYQKLGYSRDEASPNDRVMRNKVIKADYVIMSKSID
jgi:ribosomal protein S18 acetylase RimI-like enzyme